MPPDDIDKIARIIRDRFFGDQTDENWQACKEGYLRDTEEILKRLKAAGYDVKRAR